MTNAPTPSRPTLSPWEYTDSGLVYGQPAADDDEAPFVCDVCVDTGLMTEEEEANARLIAAAPDLLEACEWMVCELCEAWDEVLQKAIPERFLTAIAQAKGGAQ